MPPETIASVIGAVRDLWPVADDVEITMEANPTSVEAARFAAARDAGVNRVSLGVQALDDESLRFLGRAHSLDEALTAIATARATFARYSFDLIYARPGQTPAAWRAELERALDLAGEHMSLYSAHARARHALLAGPCARRLRDARRGHRGDAVRGNQCADGRTRPAGLARSRTTRAGRGLPPQPDLLALRGLRRRRAGGAWPLRRRSRGSGCGKRATRQASGPEAWLEQVESRVMRRPRIALSTRRG